MHWHISSYSISVNCVQAGWHTASGPQGNCVEAQWAKPESAGCPYVHIRDTKQDGFDDRIVLDIPRAAWDDGAGMVFEPVTFHEIATDPGGRKVLAVATLRTPNAGAMNWYKITSGASPGHVLYFHQDEADAFRAGVAGREFALA